VPLGTQTQVSNRNNLSLAKAAPVDLTGVQRLLDVSAVRAANDLELLLALTDRKQPWTALVKDVGIRLYAAADDGLPLAEHRLDDHPVEGPGGRIGREHHSRCLGEDHLLDDDRNRRLLGQLLLGPIGQHPLAVQRRPAVFDAPQHVGESDDIGEAGIHPGERAVARVLGRSRRPHRDSDIVPEPAICVLNGICDLSWDGRGHDFFACGPLGLGKRAGIVGIKLAQKPCQSRPRARLRDGFEVRGGGHHEARRHR
jgi:hypothetical protein